MDDELKLKITNLLKEMPLDELSYTIGRYSGRQNALLSERKFGFSIPTDLAREIHDRRLLDIEADKFLLGDET